MNLDRFYAFVESVRDVPFEWGTHDCITFANSAVRCYRGHGFCDDWLGGYSTELGAACHAKRLLHLNGFPGIIEAVDTRLKRIQTRYPSRGCVVARRTKGVLGFAFGVVVSDRIAFVGATGLDMSKKDQIDVYWSVE